MIVALILLALLVAAAVAPLLGRDSRGLDDGSWARDGLWSRDPATSARH